MKIIEEDCVGCGSCFDICPNDAIKGIPRKDKAYSKFYIDKDLCTNCGTCSPDLFECMGEAIQEDDYISEN